MRKITAPATAILIVCTALFQLIALHLFAIGGIRPDILFSLVIFFALFGGPGMGVRSGAIIGLVRDIAGADIFGVNIFILATAGFILEKIRTNFYRESSITHVLMVGSAYLVSTSVHYLLVYGIPGMTSIYVGCAPDFYTFFTRSALPSSVYTAVLSAFLFRYLMRLFDLRETSLI